MYASVSMDQPQRASRPAAASYAAIIHDLGCETGSVPTSLSMRLLRRAFGASAGAELTLTLAMPNTV